MLKREIKSVPALSMKAYRLYIYIYIYIYMSGQLQTPAAFVPGENITDVF
jgi:hypothetical protein